MSEYILDEPAPAPDSKVLVDRDALKELEHALWGLDIRVRERDIPNDFRELVAAVRALVSP